MVDKILPGVYTEEVDSGPRPISAIATGVIGMVGSAPMGPLDESRKVSSFAEFERIYGGIESGYTLAEHVNAAFQNGAQAVRALRVAGSGATKAANTFKDDAVANTLILTAKSEGDHGNNIQIKIAAGTTGGKRTVTVIHEVTGITELYQNGDMLPGSDSYLADRINAESQIVDAGDEGSTGVPAVTTGTYLSGGLDGGTVGAGQIIGSTNPHRGLKLLETVDEINILVAADSSDSTVWAELISQCENTGDRICVLNCLNNLTPDQVISSISAVESGRAVMPYPWVTIYDYATGTNKDIPPASVVAGILSRIEPYVSPSNQQVLGIVGVKRPLTRAECETLHLSRVMPITLLSGRGYRIRNGLTLSSDPAWSQICKRRELDKIEESVEEAMSWAISRPHTPTLRDNVKTSVSNFLYTLVSFGEVGAGYSVKCDAGNNPPASVQAGYLICDVGIEFLYPADKVVFRYSESLAEGFTGTPL